MENCVNTTLTDEQVEYIAQNLDESVKGTVLEDIANMPSNQGQETTDPETRETGEPRKMMVQIDPNSGEHKILGQQVEEGLEDNETFEEMCKRLENSDFETDKTPITEHELRNKVINKSTDMSVSNELFTETLSDDSIRQLLTIVNRKQNGEEFNIYKEFPDEIKKMIDKYMFDGGITVLSTNGKQFRNMICEQLIQEYITNISMERAQSDFNKELETVFQKGNSDIANSIVGYTVERNKAYRDYANGLGDEAKKEKILAILDAIDEAYNLTKLIEFSKTCKIKKFSLEKPKRHYDDFLRKYQESPYNIYNIELALPILYRNLNIVSEEYSDKDVNAFFLCFCKYCLNMSPEIVTDHAFMYYTIYNIVLMDMNKGESKDISEKFSDNIKLVIKNLRERNNNFK